MKNLHFQKLFPRKISIFWGYVLKSVNFNKFYVTKNVKRSMRSEKFKRISKYADFDRRVRL